MQKTDRTERQDVYARITAQIGRPRKGRAPLGENSSLPNRNKNTEVVRLVRKMKSNS